MCAHLLFQFLLCPYVFTIVMHRFFVVVFYLIRQMKATNMCDMRVSFKRTHLIHLSENTTWFQIPLDVSFIAAILVTAQVENHVSCLQNRIVTPTTFFRIMYVVVINFKNSSNILYLENIILRDY